MALRLLQGQYVGGVWYQAFDVVVGLSPEQEALLIQGGGATTVNLAVLSEEEAASVSLVRPITLAELDDPPPEVLSDQRSIWLDPTGRRFFSTGSELHRLTEAPTIRAGTLSEMLAVADAIDGDSFRVTSGAGAFKSWWDYDASTAKWSPSSGRRLLVAKGVGSKASPVASVTYAGNATILLKNVSIPANLLRPGCELIATALITREGTTDTSGIQHRLGTAGTSSDSPIGLVSFTASNPAGGQGIAPNARLYVQDSTHFTSTVLAAGSTTGSSTVPEQTTNLNTAADMQFGWWTSGATSGDTFVMLAYSIEIVYGV